MRLPAQAARQLPDQSTTLRVESSSTDDPRLRGALPNSDIAVPFFDHLSARWMSSAAPQIRGGLSWRERGASNNRGRSQLRKARMSVLFGHQRPYRLGTPEFIVDADTEDIVAETDRFRNARYDIKKMR
jgi:hypothetical protein